MTLFIDEREHGPAPETTRTDSQNFKVEDGVANSSDSRVTTGPTADGRSRLRLAAWVRGRVLERRWFAALTVTSALVAVAATAYALEHPDRYTELAETLDFALGAHLFVELGLRLAADAGAPKR